MKTTLLMALLSFFATSTPIQAAKAPVPKTALEQTQALSAAEKSKPHNSINLNTADAKTLAKSIKGIGKKRAEAIIKYRGEHGKFQAVNELADVPGLGKGFVLKNIDQLQEVFSVN